MADGVPKTVEDRSVSVEPKRQFWQVPWDFAVHGIVGTSIFGIIAVFAVVLDVCVRWLETHQISSVVIIALEAAEYGLLFTDIYLFVVFLWRTARRTLKDL